MDVSFAAALGLTQIGEFSFILAASALHHGLIGSVEFQYFLSLAVSSLLLTPLLFALGVRGSAHGGWPELASALSEAIKRRGLGGSPAPAEPAPVASTTVSLERKTIVIGLGHAGRSALAKLNENGIPCVGVDMNLENVTDARAHGLEALYGDATRADVLHAAGVQAAFLVIVSVTGKHITPQVVATVRRLNPDVEILTRVHYLNEIPSLVGVTGDQVVVSESETAGAIVRRALARYGLAES